MQEENSISENFISKYSRRYLPESLLVEVFKGDGGLCPGTGRKLPKAGGLIGTGTGMAGGLGTGLIG